MTWSSNNSECKNGLTTNPSADGGKSSPKPSRTMHFAYRNAHASPANAFSVPRNTFLLTWSNKITLANIASNLAVALNRVARCSSVNFSFCATPTCDCNVSLHLSSASFDPEYHSSALLFEEYSFVNMIVLFGVSKYSSAPNQNESTFFASIGSLQKEGDIFVVVVSASFFLSNVLVGFSIPRVVGCSGCSGVSSSVFEQQQPIGKMFFLVKVVTPKRRRWIPQKR
mmetsp:Transcript_2925/g.8998  ORF Transcript_2925/g.8998 Transcript_2925/m.8998 type:complete len:226 (+) Transcript_2925:629-1306(+)